MGNWNSALLFLIPLVLAVCFLPTIISMKRPRKPQHLQALFQTSFDGILIVDENKKILAANPSFLKISGFQAEEVVNQKFCIITNCDKRFRADECLGQCLVLSTIRKGESLPYLETGMAKKNGTIVPAAITVASFKRERGLNEAAIIIRSLGVEKGLAKKLTRKLKQIKNEQKRSEALLQLGLELLSMADFDRRLQAVVDRIRQVMYADLAGLLLMEQEGKYLYWKALSGKGSNELKSRIVNIEGELLGRILETGQPIGMKDSVEAGRIFSATFGDIESVQVKGFLGVPVQVRGKITGILCVAKRLNRSFSHGEVQMLSILANQVAVSVENEALWQQIENQAALRERHWLADEIHDGLAQSVASLQGQIKDIYHLLEEGRQPEAEIMLGQLISLADTAYQEVRQAIFSLKGTTDFAGDFKMTLEENIAEFSLQHHIPVRLNSSELSLFRLAPNIETQLMRIIQEALTNVGKHAQASEITVEFSTWGKHHLRVSIADNGRGFDPAELKNGCVRRYGLRIMEERARSIRGTFFIESSPGKGTVVTIQVPCREKISQDEEKVIG